MANLFAKFEGPPVEGGSTAEGHKNDLEIFSLSHGFSLPAYFAPDARVNGTVSHQDVSMVFELNSATVPMLKSVFTGANFDKVTIFCYRASGQESTSKQQRYLTVTLEQAICSGVSLSGSKGSSGTVSISLNYAKVQYEYDPQKPDSTGEGKQVISYDLKTKKTA